VHAIADSCPHNGAPLATGQLEGTTIKCRAHGLRFDIATGCPSGASGFALRTYSARVHDGRVELPLGAAD
jgi:3-phenylpropionate/trans-cinnamate dioxygenase ferredoxin subunit